MSQRRSSIHGTYSVLFSGGAVRVMAGVRSLSAQVELAGAHPVENEGDSSEAVRVPFLCNRVPEGAPRLPLIPARVHSLCQQGSWPRQEVVLSK